MHEPYPSLIVDMHQPVVDFDQNRITVDAAPLSLPGGVVVEGQQLSARDYRGLAIQSSVEAGRLPPLDNGFRFVIDTRPPGHENDAIPAERFTQYFADDQVPVADKGHRLRDHDQRHIPDYQKMFQSESFADLVRRAARNSVGDPNRCEQFTNTLDSLGDYMRDLGGYRHNNPTLPPVLLPATRNSIQGLMILAESSTATAYAVTPSNQRMLKIVERQLGLTSYRVAAKLAVARATR